MMCFVYQVYQISCNISFFSRHFTLVGHLRFGLIHFSLSDVFYLGGGHLRLESFCIRVNIVYFKMCESDILHCKISNMGRRISFLFLLHL